MADDKNQQKRAIKKVAVIGAGAMGSGIAAQLANAGVQVYMLDKNPDTPDAAIKRMLKASPATDALNAGFMSPANAKLIKTGNTDDHLEEAVKDADWVIEVIIEDLGLKNKLFAEIDKHRKPGTIVSSNTSTIPLKAMADGRSDDFKKNFVITHFFNPPRFMRLLELVSGPETDPAVTDTMRDFCDVKLGKNVVDCKDTPGFIANRIGAYFLFRAITEAIDSKIAIEDVDAVLSRPMGLPKEGVFGLLDMVGIGLVPHITQSLAGTLPPEDGFQKIYRNPKITDTLLAHGHWGRNAPGGGFYRMRKNADGSKVKQVIDMKKASAMFESGAWDIEFGNGKNAAALEALYHDAERPKLASVAAGKKGPRATFEAGDHAGDYAWKIMRDTLLYAAALVPEIGDDISKIDAAMRDGYNWKYGPFELLDKVGVDWFVKRAEKDGVEIPPLLAAAKGKKFYMTHKGTPQRLALGEDGKAAYVALEQSGDKLRLSDIKRGSKPLVTGHSASLWDIGDGVVCFEFHSKMNSIDPSILHVMNESLKLIGDGKGKYKAMVVYNEAPDFSVGANLAFAQAVAGYKKWGVVDDFLYYGQRVYQAMRYAPVPVIGAPSGKALGGGCEILLHCDAIQASAETYTGLVEMAVGIVPGWGGCVRYLDRAQNMASAPGGRKGPLVPLKAAFGAIMAPNLSVSSSGQDAKQKLWLGPQDGITMNRDRLLADAKAKALAMVPGYKPPQPSTFNLPGATGKATLQMAVDGFYRKGDATWHDVVIGDALADVLSGGDTNISITLTESDLLQKEREALMSLIKTPQSQKRIAHMMNTGKPLREEPLTESKTMAEIRANRDSITLPKRVYDGKPVTGADGCKLRLLAGATWLMYKMNG